MTKWLLALALLAGCRSTTPGLADVPRGRELQGYGRLTENLIFIAYEGDGAGREDLCRMGAAFEAAASL